MDFNPPKTQVLFTKLNENILKYPLSIFTIFYRKSNKKLPHLHRFEK